MTRTSRAAVSLLEVLFAMLVATIGLLGAIAILPVAIEQANKGRRADAQSIAGEAAVNDFKVRGCHVPERWVVHDGTNFLNYATINGQGTWYWVSGSDVIYYDYAGGRWMNQTTGAAHSYTGTPPAANTAYCFDPRGVASYLPGTASFREFPTSGAGPRMWRAGMLAVQNSTAYPPAFQPRRPLSSVDLRFAEEMVKCYDELRFQRSTRDRTLDPVQEYAGTLRRQTEPLREFSWFATVVPKPNVSDSYVLSVVVAFRRSLPAAGPNADAERVIDRVTINGDGSSGGEMTLNGSSEGSLRLANGDWVLLKGTDSGTSYFNWYRVIDTEPTARGSGTTWQRHVTLYGGDWPVAAANTQAVVVEGVSAVYERTIRLQRSSLWQ